MLGLEASAKVTCRGGIGDALGAEGIQEMEVLAAPFDILQTIAVAQRVVGDIENVVGLMIGKMKLEQVQVTVDGLDQAEASCQEMKAPMPPSAMP